jgi:hypothetical protein
MFFRKFEGEWVRLDVNAVMEIFIYNSKARILMVYLVYCDDKEKGS